MDSIPAGRTSPSRPRQPENAPTPMLMTFSGISRMPDKRVLWAKIQFPTALSADGRTSFPEKSHPLKQCSPREVRLSGSTSSPLNGVFSNARPSIEDNPSLRIRFPSKPVLEKHLTGSTLTPFGITRLPRRLPQFANESSPMYFNFSGRWSSP